MTRVGETSPETLSHQTVSTAKGIMPQGDPADVRESRGVSEISSKILGEAAERCGPIPEAFMFGDGIDWSSPLRETMLYVELPFWLMVPSGPVRIQWRETEVIVHVCPQWMEVFAQEVTDSRKSVLHQGPWEPEYEPAADVAELLRSRQVPVMTRRAKTVLRFEALGHESAFREIGEDEPPRAHRECEAYWASLCEAHIPLVNELIQRYRLVTYDYFAYEVSAWDVPVWYLKHQNQGFTATLLPYMGWDVKPVTIEDGDGEGAPPRVEPFEWATLLDLNAVRSDDASPGEFDLLDARSLMERGDYTGAVRRTVTAIEAILEWALIQELSKLYPKAEAIARAAKTDNDYPGRRRQWRKLAKPPITQGEFDEFERTRQIRHDIVHNGRRLTHEDRGRAQRAVDTGRWLYNKIEASPDRAHLRDYGSGGVLRSAGRGALAPRFSPEFREGRIVLRSMASDLPPLMDRN